MSYSYVARVPPVRPGPRLRSTISVIAVEMACNAAPRPAADVPDGDGLPQMPDEDSRSGLRFPGCDASIHNDVAGRVQVPAAAAPSGEPLSV